MAQRGYRPCKGTEGLARSFRLMKVVEHLSKYPLVLLVLVSTIRDDQTEIESAGKVVSSGEGKFQIETFPTQSHSSTAVRSNLVSKSKCLRARDLMETKSRILKTQVSDVDVSSSACLCRCHDNRSCAHYGIHGQITGSNISTFSQI